MAPLDLVYVKLEPANLELVDLRLQNLEMPNLEMPNLEMPNLEMQNLEMPKQEPRGPALFQKRAVTRRVPLESESKAALPAGAPVAKLHPALAVLVP
jgi:hypothetical protein